MSEQSERELAQAIREFAATNIGLDAAVSGLADSVARLDKTVARMEGTVDRLDKTVARHTEAVDRNTAAIGRMEAAVDRNTQTLADQANGLRGLTDALLDKEPESDEEAAPSAKRFVVTGAQGSHRRSQGQGRFRRR